MLIGFAFDIEIDRQGRLLIPPKLREYSASTARPFSWASSTSSNCGAESWQQNMKGWPDTSEDDEEELRELRI